MIAKQSVFAAEKDPGRIACLRIAMLRIFGIPIRHFDSESSGKRAGRCSCRRMIGNQKK